MAEIPDILGKKLIITGEVNTGKTRLSRAVMDALCRGGFSAHIIVLDMAPEIPEKIAIERGMQGIGGKLTAPCEAVAYLTASIHPPRLTAKTAEEAFLIAAENAATIDRLLEEFQGSGRDILFINDVSMYLQAGSARDLLRRIESARTVVANGYYGRKLGGGMLSSREADEMEKLISAFACHVRLPGQSIEEALKEK
jgi:hypothetical protein